MKLVLSDDHDGLEAAVAELLETAWRRCRIHFMRNAVAHVYKGRRKMVAALIRTVFARKSEAEACRQGRTFADRLRKRFPKNGTLMGAADDPVVPHELRDSFTAKS